MSDYTYNPVVSDISEFAENQDVNFSSDSRYDYQDEAPVAQSKSSTSLEELDEIEMINRNSAEFSKVRNETNFPDPLKKPLYLKVVPETGLINSKTNLKNERTSRLSEQQNNYNNRQLQKKKLSAYSINEILTMVSTSLIDIINDLLSYRFDSNIIDIFTKEERLFSIGVLSVIISVFFVFFKKS